MDTPRTTPPGRRGVVAGVVVLVGLSVATQLVLAATAEMGDPFDSPLYPWTWLALPLAAALASAWRPGALTPVWFTAALVVPLLIGTFLLGTVLHDGSGGASLWAVGELVHLAQGVVILAAAYLGALVGHLVRRSRHRPAAAPS